MLTTIAIDVPNSTWNRFVDDQDFINWSLANQDRGSIATKVLYDPPSKYSPICHKPHIELEMLKVQLPKFCLNHFPNIVWHTEKPDNELKTLDVLQPKFFYDPPSKYSLTWWQLLLLMNLPKIDLLMTKFFTHSSLSQHWIGK